MAIQAQLYSENLGFPLGGPQDLMMENACGFNDFSFNPHQQQLLNQKQQNAQYQYQQLQFLQQRNQNQNSRFEDISFVRRNCTNAQKTMAVSQTLAAQIEKQWLEIDRFISLQNERLKLALQEQRKQQVALLLRKYESKTQILLKQKDEEIAKAANRTMELEDFLKRMEIENQTWQRVAKENEAMVMSLNNAIEQLRESACLSTNGAEDAESCCDMIETWTAEQTGKESPEIDRYNGEARTRKMMCKSCNSRSSSIILLPCRHLCSCKACEAFLDSCPVCFTAKKASIEALI